MGSGIDESIALTLFVMGRAFAAVLCVFAVGTAAAQPAVERPVAIGYGALPGGVHVPEATPLRQGVVGVVALGGYGFRKELLAPNHSMMRAQASVAAAYGVHELVSVGLAIDGRYDRHTGPAPSPDDGFVGDPRLFVRGAATVGGARIGGQIGILVPGKNAPSIAFSAISVDARALASMPVGPAMVSLGAGFRLDNSAKSVSDGTGAAGTGPSRLSLQDRVSLGVSDFHAALGGVRVAIPTGNAWVAAEGSVEAFLGKAPRTGSAVTEGHADLANGKMTLRGAISGGLHLNAQWSVFGFAELAKVPNLTSNQISDGNIPLVPYEPMVSFGVGVGAQLGGASHGHASAPEHSCDVANDDASVEACPSEPILATISGTVMDDTDKPVSGAQVTIRLKGAQPLVVTDAAGRYKIEVPVGKKYRTKFHGDVVRIVESAAQVDVRVDGKKPATTLIVKLIQGANSVEPIKLESQLPPGQLRGVVRSLPGGKAVGGAAISIAPGDRSVTSAPDGTFSIDLAPGTYKISVKARGLSTQELDVSIDPNGVVIKNIDLHR